MAADDLGAGPVHRGGPRRRGRPAAAPAPSEAPPEDEAGRPLDLPDPAPDPGADAALADAVGVALVVVLDRRRPDERLAFVLHDVFGLPFEEVASILGRSPAATRQLARRARRRVRGAPEGWSADVAARAHVVAAFVDATRGRLLDELLRLLGPDVTLTIDASLLAPGAPRTVEGAATVGTRTQATAGAAEVMLVDGVPGLVAAPGGRVSRVLTFRVEGGRIASIEAIAGPERLRRLDLRLLPPVAG